jgi:hypothetical protein
MEVANSLIGGITTCSTWMTHIQLVDVSQGSHILVYEFNVNVGKMMNSVGNDGSWNLLKMNGNLHSIKPRIAKIALKHVPRHLQAISPYLISA